MFPCRVTAIQPLKTSTEIENKLKSPFEFHQEGKEMNGSFWDVSVYSVHAQHDLSGFCRP